MDTAKSKYLNIAGGDCTKDPIRVGIWAYGRDLQSVFRNFAILDRDIQNNRWAALAAYGLAHGIAFLYPEREADLAEIDAILFLDCPRLEDPAVARLLNSDIAKYLFLWATSVDRPDNWNLSNHVVFDRIFTWDDRYVDERRILKINASIDPTPLQNFEDLKATFHQRKLCTLIADHHESAHPDELYSQRKSTIAWFETNAASDFDLFGEGWNSKSSPSYRGTARSRTDTLAQYRFAICYENTKNAEGCITEIMLECFRAGVVPVYLGAPNIKQWIPQDCFIDRQIFQDDSDLFHYLATMSVAEYSAYIDSISALLNSERIYPFSIECFITTLTSFIARDSKLRRGACPDISIIIPTYNYGQFLQLSVASALLQDVEKLEVLVYDNASTDETQEILARFSGDTRLRCMRNTWNIGGHYNWRNGIIGATGRYFAILCADDFYLPYHLGRMLRTLDAHPTVSIGYCPPKFVDAAGNAAGGGYHAGRTGDDYVGGRNEVADLLTFDNYINPSVALIRRTAFDLIGRSDESLFGSGDWDLWIKIAEKKPDFAFFKDSRVCFRVHSGQITVSHIAGGHALTDHITILWNTLERGSLHLIQSQGRQIFALLKQRFEKYPPASVGHLRPHLDALEAILLGHAGAVTIAQARVEATRLERLLPEGVQTTSTLSQMHGTHRQMLVSSNNELDVMELINSATHLQTLKRLDLAADLYRQWLNSNISSLSYAVAFNLGTVLEEAGSLIDATNAYARSLAYNPNFAPSHYSLANVLEQCGYAETARLHWHWLIKEENNIAEIQPAWYAKALEKLAGYLK